MIVNNFKSNTYNKASFGSKSLTASPDLMLTPNEQNIYNSALDDGFDHRDAITLIETRRRRIGFNPEPANLRIAEIKVENPNLAPQQVEQVYYNDLQTQENLLAANNNDIPSNGQQLEAYKKRVYKENVGIVDKTKDAVINTIQAADRIQRKRDLIWPSFWDPILDNLPFNNHRANILESMTGAYRRKNLERSIQNMAKEIIASQGQNFTPQQVVGLLGNPDIRAEAVHRLEAKGEIVPDSKSIDIERAISTIANNTLKGRNPNLIRTDAMVIASDPVVGSKSELVLADPEENTVRQNVNADVLKKEIDELMEATAIYNRAIQRRPIRVAALNTGTEEQLVDLLHDSYQFCKADSARAINSFYKIKKDGDGNIIGDTADQLALVFYSDFREKIVDPTISNDIDLGVEEKRADLDPSGKTLWAPNIDLRGHKISPAKRGEKKKNGEYTWLAPPSQALDGNLSAELPRMYLPRNQVFKIITGENQRRLAKHYRNMFDANKPGTNQYLIHLFEGISLDTIEKNLKNGFPLYSKNEESISDLVLQPLRTAEDKLDRYIEGNYRSNPKLSKQGYLERGSDLDFLIYSGAYLEPVLPDPDRPGEFYSQEDFYARVLVPKLPAHVDDKEPEKKEETQADLLQKLASVAENFGEIGRALRDTIPKEVEIPQKEVERVPVEVDYHLGGQYAEQAQAAEAQSELTDFDEKFAAKHDPYANSGRKSQAETTSASDTGTGFDMTNIGQQKWTGRNDTTSNTSKPVSQAPANPSPIIDNTNQVSPTQDETVNINPSSPVPSDNTNNIKAEDVTKVEDNPFDAGLLDTNTASTPAPTTTTQAEVPRAVPPTPAPAPTTQQTEQQLDKKNILSDREKIYIMHSFYFKPEDKFITLRGQQCPKTKLISRLDDYGVKINYGLVKAAEALRKDPDADLTMHNGKVIKNEQMRTALNNMKTRIAQGVQMIKEQEKYK